MFLDEIDAQTYEVLECGEVSFTVNNPPQAPSPQSPGNYSVVYCTALAGCRNQNFTWKEPSDWGWLGEGKQVLHEYSFDLFKGETAKKENETVYNTYYAPLCLEEGQYKWRVAAKPDTKAIYSDYQYFSVCAVNPIDPLRVTHPQNGEYVGRDVTISWEKPNKNTECANDSEYSYFITIEGPSRYNEGKTLPFNETELVLTNLEEGDYKWKIEARGPADEVSSTDDYKFHVCVPRAPSAPMKLTLAKMSTTICTAGNENHKLAFSWEGPTDEGSQCVDKPQALKYRMEVYNSSGKIDEHPEIVSGTEISVPCAAGNYKVLLYADNSFSDSVPAEYNFVICPQSKPAQPTVHSILNAGYCSTTTKISWSHDDWGESCDASRASMFKIECTQEGKTPYKDSINITAALLKDTYSEVIKLDEGVWDVSITACTLDGKLCSEPGRGTVNASMIPKIVNPEANNDGEKITFSWTTDDRTLDCLRSVEFKYTIVLYIDEKENCSSVLPVTKDVAFEIPINYDTIQWRVTLNRSGDEGITMEMDPYSAGEDCKIVKPKWVKMTNALVEPGLNSVVFGDVTFKWSEVDSFGVACREDAENEAEIKYIKDNNATRRYTVTVGDTVFNASSDVTSITEQLSTYGYHTWNVTAHNGNVSTSTPAQSFCHANNPPDFKAICPEGFYLDDVLSWDAVDCKNNAFSLFQIYYSFSLVGATCDRNYGFRVRHGNDIIVETKENSFKVDKSIYDGSFTWSVESFIDDITGTPQTCTTELCTIKPPSKPTFNEPTEATKKDGKWTFTWAVPKKYDSMCGIKTSFSYEVNVTVRNETITKITSEPSITLEFNESGDYPLSVRIFDGISYSDPTNTTLELCIPQEIR